MDSKSADTLIKDDAGREPKRAKPLPAPSIEELEMQWSALGCDSDTDWY